MEGHRKRLRERFLKAGIKGFNDREALELLLTYAAPRKDMRKLSVDLLNKFGSLKNILEQPPSNLMLVDNIGESTAILLSLFSQLNAMSEKPKKKTKITGPDEVAEYLKKRLGSQRRERFSAILLSSSNNLLAEVDLEYGTVNRTQVYPRNLVEKVIAHSAAGVILVHNHPGGKTDPSREDLALTRKLIKLGEDMDFRILDHFIVTEDDIISLKAMGLLER
ncbi:MAG: DNA repair protein RadC [Candidatus Sabulitectum sp.]|nr:DNA repair protein RadC [Candidatus Sabulitectum sp.]